MIKIEIIDPARENPDMLVKIATLLMDLAGHAIVKAPDDFGKRMLRAELTPDELPEQGHRPFTPKPQSFEVLGVEQSQKPCIETYENPPYQHCAESGLTEEHFKKATNDLIDTVLPPPVIAPKNLGDVMSNGSIELKDMEIPEHSHLGVEKPIVSEKPKSTTKRKRAPKFEVIKETGVPEVVEDLLPPPAPVLTPMVNGNVLVDKILVAKTQGMVTHDEITAIVRKHGLVAIKDIFTNDALIPAINADLDELLRRK